MTIQQALDQATARKKLGEDATPSQIRKFLGTKCRPAIKAFLSKIASPQQRDAWKDKLAKVFSFVAPQPGLAPARIRTRNKYSDR